MNFGIQCPEQEMPVHLRGSLHPRDLSETKLHDGRSFRYMGDSCVTEVYGFGGMCAIAGPAYMRLTGSTFEEAVSRTEKARSVSLGEHTFAPVPWNKYKGMPVGIDIRKVVGFNVLPISHGGSGLKTGGQAGAGAAQLPMECFKKALLGMAEELQIV